MESPAVITKLLADYGPWGMLALSLYAIRWLFLRYDKVQEARVTDGKENAALAARMTVALNETNGLIAESSARAKASLMLLEKNIERGA